LQLWALVSAYDSSRAWDLRSYVREKLVEFPQRRYPKSLPRARAELEWQPTTDLHNVAGTGAAAP
jgi:hypothetical protein